MSIRLAIWIILGTMALIMAFNVNAQTTYVPGDFPRIQWAVDNASDGDTIVVRDGIYSENVVIHKRIALLSENGHEFTSVRPLDENESVFLISASNVTISGFNISGVKGQYKAGIYVSRVKNCTVSENRIFNSYNGIRMMTSSYCNVYRNEIHDVMWGIALMSWSSYNDIRNNEVYNSTGSVFSSGIYIYPGSNNNVSENRLYQNTNGIYVWREANNNRIVNNTVFNNSISGIAIKSSRNNTIKECEIYGNYHGIYVYDSPDNKILSNNLHNNENGIYLYKTGSNLISGNDIVGNGIGIRGYSSYGSEIFLNNISYNTKDAEMLNSANLWNPTEPVNYVFGGIGYSNYLGNHWGNFTGNDNDGDGVIDAFYHINQNNTDYNPLFKSPNNYVIEAGETIPDSVNDNLEQIVTKYNPSFDWRTKTPSKQDVLDAVINAVVAYFTAPNQNEKQDILTEVIQLVGLYFLL